MRNRMYGQGYKYNFESLLSEFLTKYKGRTVKGFFLKKFGKYNSYIRKRTKNRSKLKVIVVYAEFGSSRGHYYHKQLLDTREEGKVLRDPGGIHFGRISRPESILNRRKLLRSRNKFIS